jgi:hypothetical protein
MTKTDYLRMPPENIYSDYLEMIHKLVVKNAACSKLNKRDRLFQHEMFVKYAFHLASILTLEHGSRFSLSDDARMAYDYSSVIVLLRAALETYLTYYYIYSDSSGEDDYTFRFHNWLIDGLNFRQSIDVSFSEELQQQKQKEGIELLESIKVIENTDAFRRLSEKQKRLATKKRQWIRPGWAEVITKTGIGEYWARTFYALFSAYAHTSSQSIMQFKEATVKNEGKQLNSSFASLIFIVTAMFIESYVEDFGLGNTLNNGEAEMIEAWIWLSKHMPQS